LLFIFDPPNKQKIKKEEKLQKKLKEMMEENKKIYQREEYNKTPRKLPKTAEEDQNIQD
jgi:formiminotetrahydrofolate cyclodeaminase